jgi:2-dehydro-3-deoxyphosphogluconate aldolase/(4S)-4-hydroxy-2-oxoglutarate aldolase
VSPGRATQAREVADAAGIPFLEGGFTPSEIALASAAGPAKLFPASLGGPDHLRALLSVLPDRGLVPTGGVRLSEVPRWLAAGALAVGVGSDLLRAPDLRGAVAALLSAATPK